MQNALPFKVQPLTKKNEKPGDEKKISGKLFLEVQGAVAHKENMEVDSGTSLHAEHAKFWDHLMLTLSPRSDPGERKYDSSCLV